MELAICLKGAKFLEDDISSMVYNCANQKYKNWFLNYNYHFGGYAKINSELVHFINKFEVINNIKLDPIYTGKMMYAINDMIKTGEIPENKNILSIHTGGLQGIEGMKEKMEKIIS